MWDKLELRLKSLKAYRNYLGKGKVMLYPKNKDAKYMLILNDINDETLESADLLNSFEGKKLRDIFNFISIDIGKMYITSLYKMQKI